MSPWYTSSFFPFSRPRTDLRNVFHTTCGVVSHVKYLKRLFAINESFHFCRTAHVGTGVFLKCHSEEVSVVISGVWGTKRESSVCESGTEVRTHSACVHTEKGVSLPVPRQPEQCSNGPRLHGSAFAQTVTPLLVTTTDGVSHAHCEEGYVTPLRMPSCVFHPIRTTHTRRVERTRGGKERTLLN